MILHPFLPLLEDFEILGTAIDNDAVDHIELKYDPVLPILGAPATTPAATCPNCPAGSVSWHDSPPLMMPGLYTVTGIAVDRAGNKSDPEKYTFLVIIS